MIPNPLLETHGPLDSLTLEKAEFHRKRFSWKEGPRQFLARYSWDDAGRLTSIEEREETRLYAYDDLDRETACYRMDDTGQVFERTLTEWEAPYRMKRRVTRSKKDPEETISTYEHDDAGRMTAEKQGDRVCVEKRSRTGLVEQEYLYEGEKPDLVTDYTYDEYDRLISICIKDPDGRIHQATSHDYDEHGRPAGTKIKDSEGRTLQDESFAYGATLGNRWLERVAWIPDGSRRGKRKPSEVIYRSFTLGEGQPGIIPESERTLAFANGLYTGLVTEGKPEGTGIFRYNDESVYEGEFHDGVMSGKGCLVWPDGRQMEGLFTGGLLEGHGTCVWTDGSRYEGAFHNGKMHGPGIFTWADGTHFEGLFEKGQRTDQGAWEKK